MLPVTDIEAVMSRVYGKDVSVFEKSFLAKSVERRILLLNGISKKPYAEVLSEDENEANIFFDSLTINYSEFFRNPLSFALLEKTVLPRLIKDKIQNSGIRIWSAGCAAGQEAFSLAMVADELIRKQDKSINLRIFGTDISEKSLAIAIKGKFETSELGNVYLRRILEYFDHRGDIYTVSDHLKSSINFSLYDLLDANSVSPAASIFGDFDLICCCNVLFYYGKEIRQAILNKLYFSLSPKGFLITGDAECEIVPKDKFRPVFPSAAVFQKIW